MGCKYSILAQTQAYQPCFFLFLLLVSEKKRIMKKTLLSLLIILCIYPIFSQEVIESIVVNKNFSNEVINIPQNRTHEITSTIDLPFGHTNRSKTGYVGAVKDLTNPTKRILAPGESVILSVNGNSITEDTTHLGITFSNDIENAIQRVPQWLQYDLRFKFKVVTSSATRTKMVNLINRTPKKYLDEVAYVITYLPVEALTYSRLPEDWSHLVDNASLIYLHADSLQYVELVEHGDTISGDWFTTTKYKIKQGSNYIWREIDKYYYYQFIVMPKVEQEYVATVDNLTSISAYRTWGYFWRDYLWNDYAQAVNPADTAYRGYHNVNTWGYVAINSSGDRDTVRIDTIPRLGNIMQMPAYLWDENYSIWLFNRSFTSSQSAMNVLGNWASRCIPQDVTSESDYRPSEPNHIAWKHVGNCHEDAMMLVAAARTALIPCIHVADLCDDHVWTAFHDGEDTIWHHFEFFRGGCSAGRPYYWGMTNMQDNGNYGWKSSLVQGYAPDGHMINLSEKYSSSTPCTLNLTVTDNTGVPVDGALVHLYSTNTQYGTTYVMSAGYLWTDSEGKISVKLGNGKKYYMKISHPKYGSYPTTSGQAYNLITSNATANHTYTLSYEFPDSCLSYRHHITSAQQQYAASQSLQLTLDARNITSSTNPADVQSSTFYERTNTPAGLNIYTVNESQLAAFQEGNRTANVEYDFGALTSGSINLPVHQSGKTYIVLTNNNNFKNYVEVSFDATLVAGGDFPVSITEHAYDVHQLDIFPNPASNNLYYTISDNEIGSSIHVYDLAGRLLKQEQMTSTTGHIDIQDLLSGIYIVRTGYNSRKFVKE